MSNPDSPGGAGLDVEAVASAARAERDGERGGDAVRGFVKSVFQMHLALVVTAALVVGALMNVIWVAKFDAPTILALLSVANRTHLLLAAASHLLVLAIVVLFVMVIIRTLVYGEDLPGGVTARQLAVPVAVFVGLPVFLSWLTPMFAALLLLFGLWEYAAQRRGRTGRRRDADRSMLSSDGRLTARSSRVLIIALTILANFAQPWTPKEYVDVAHADDIVGYVIGEQGNMTMVLDEDLSVQWVETSDLAGRRVCADESAWWDTELTEYMHAKDYQPCDEPDGREATPIRRYHQRGPL